MTANGKSCGDCGLCCKVMGVGELNKAPGQWCAHFLKGGGCGVYLDRPPSCRSFHCEWLLSDKLGDEWKPDKARFVLSWEEEKSKLSIVCDPAQPTAWKREPYLSQIRGWAARGKTDGTEIMVCINDQRIVIFDDREIDLGIVNPDHKVVCGYARHEGVLTPFALVVSDELKPTA
jgi:hypothetical protein